MLQKEVRSKTPPPGRWYLAFDKPRHSQTVFRMLSREGYFVECGEALLHCPDKTSRYAIEVDYALISQMEGLTVAYTRNTVKFRTLRRKTPGSQLEFWPPGSKDGLEIWKKQNVGHDEAVKVAWAPKVRPFPPPESNPAPWES